MTYAINDDKTKSNIIEITGQISLDSNYVGHTTIDLTQYGLTSNKVVILMAVMQNVGNSWEYNTTYDSKAYPWLSMSSSNRLTIYVHGTSPMTYMNYKIVLMKID